MPKWQYLKHRAFHNFGVACWCSHLDLDLSLTTTIREVMLLKGIFLSLLNFWRQTHRPTSFPILQPRSQKVTCWAGDMLAVCLKLWVNILSSEQPENFARYWRYYLGGRQLTGLSVMFSTIVGPPLPWAQHINNLTSSKDHPHGFVNASAYLVWVVLLFTKLL